ncbi:class I SAM-dependent methyltransferase [Legionella maioricensis]|uniref:Class I SAM-dependent methyltransferase n=1 Tax=Legionella maioricensis TaxID=2896528 RepID=A0A9X2D028_9GAMM|nr:class I SAM-dependent methyltransferase [Legionella maioricensis]MCL9683882.1 class I SAM-dependent methyltransferase [Legionella maioricensis]MCL9686729.1 class I SAM-dependent methyltransferase [Legionella maioricensis]
MKASKLRQIYRFLMQLSPHLRLILIRWLYNKFAANNKSKQCVFLNYGYQDETTLALNSQDESNRYFIQLYNRVVKDIDLEDKDIIEVGCGQGAGGAFLIQYKKPRSYLGIDLSEKAIELCQRYSKCANARWMQGRADALPVPDHSVDVVVNVESSHCYPSMEHFLSEVWRVLRPNGYMAFTDIRQSSEVEALDKYISASGLQVLQRSDITPQVLNSLTYLSDRRKAHINATYSPIWRQAVRDISAVKGSVTYNGFINGQQKYLCYLLQKKSRE